MSTFSQDLQYGFRIFSRNPGFTLIVLISLALGIGANTAIFSLVNAVLMRPLPFHNPEQIVMVWEDASFVGFPMNTPAPANYADWKSQSQSFSDMAAVRPESFNLTGKVEPLRVQAYQVTGNFFQLLGVEPIHGRVFSVQEDKPGANNVVILSYGLWQSRFGGQKNIVGSDITLNNSKYTVVGIMPAHFQFMSPEIGMWVPIAFTQEQLQNRNSHYLEVVARIKNGVTFQKAQSEIKTIMQRIVADNPEPTGGKLGAFIVPIRDQLVGNVRRPLILLLIAVAFVLLIACANIASLLLSVAASRRKEIALRAALGADKSRLLRQLLTESFLLSIMGGILGLILGAISFRFLQNLVPPEIVLSAKLTIDAKVLLYTFGISVLTALIFGIVPALQATKTDLNESLKAGGARSGSGAGATKFRSAMVILEMAFALILLVGAGLLIQTIYRLQNLDLGFQPSNVVRLRTELPESKYDVHTKRVQFYDEVLTRLKGLSGVVSAGYTTAVPLDWKGGTNGYRWEGKPQQPGEILDANHRQVTNEYLQTIGIRLVEGRYFGPTETPTSMSVAIVNEAMARTYSPIESVIGKKFNLGGDSPSFTVVGVVRNIRNMGLEVEPKAEMYFPTNQATIAEYYSPQDLAIRVNKDPINIISSARQVIRSIDPDLPVSNVMTLDELVQQEYQHRRFTMVLLAAFAGLALLLACLGVYGVLSYFVNQQTPEIGVRLALGAQPFAILMLVLKRGMSLALIGIVCGALGALALTKVMQSILFEVSARDPKTFIGVTVMLVFLALFASIIPGRRAMKTDPVTALRYE
jgi:putative ABC transport system permease protein